MPQRMLLNHHNALRMGREFESDQTDHSCDYKGENSADNGTW